MHESPETLHLCAVKEGRPPDQTVMVRRAAFHFMCLLLRTRGWPYA